MEVQTRKLPKSPSLKRKQRTIPISDRVSKKNVFLVFYAKKNFIEMHVLLIIDLVFSYYVVTFIRSCIFNCKFH